MLILNFLIYEPLIAETRPFSTIFKSDLKLSKLLSKIMRSSNQTKTFDLKFKKDRLL